MIVISKCRLCGDRDETINHIISECSKLTQKEYKAWLGGQDDPLVDVQEIEIWSYEQMVYAQLSGRMTHKNSFGTLTYRRIT